MPGYSTLQAENLAAKYFGLHAAATHLPGELDFNFLLKTQDDERFVLKVYHVGEAWESLDAQNKLLLHLAGNLPELPLPRLIPNQAGEHITTFEDSQQQKRFVRLLTWKDGRVFAKVNPHSPELLHSLGRMLGLLCKGLQGFGHPAAHRFIKWDVAQVAWVEDKLHLIQEKEQRELAAHFYELIKNGAIPHFSALRKSVLYNDANDYNILVSNDLENPVVTGVIDFGDFVFSNTINELAIAIAYAVLDKPDPLSAAAHIVKGAHGVFPLEENELEILYYLVAARLVISVTASAINRHEHPENGYLLISERPAWELLEKWRQITPQFAHFTFRHACGMEPCPAKNSWQALVDGQQLDAVFPVDLSNCQQVKMDLSIGSLDLGNNSNFESLHQFERAIQRIIEEQLPPNFTISQPPIPLIAVGGYGEVRPFYTTDAYKAEGNQGPQWRTVHMGLDMMAAAGTAVRAPLQGRVFSFQNNKGEKDYGPTIILEHEETVAGQPFRFYTLYGHLSEASLCGIVEGQTFLKGESLAFIGAPSENGHWPPHLHFQVMLDMLGNKGDFPGVAFPERWEVWKSCCPDPMQLFSKSVGETSSHPVTKATETLRRRRQLLGPNLSISYRKPLKILRGYRQYLYDETGRRYLDTVNNVAHAGHEHPAVVRAAARQNAVLNTNTRYLHDNIVHLAEALLATLPPPLEVVFFVNSGSEANELALRLARNCTGRHGIIAVEAGYHGNTGACVDISSYKFDGPGGKGAPPFVHVLPMPDTYRGIYKEKDAGEKYAAALKPFTIHHSPFTIPPAAFICESILSCGGQIVLPEGYLKNAYRHARSMGAVCIADEVQTGLGRVGSHFWAFELQGVVPDIVTIGKPIGNGHPLAAVVTTRAIADAFANGMEYFNTFGGNPVSCAVGLEVLRIVQEEGLQKNALETGRYLIEQLKQLMRQYPIIGDVRGHGLFLGYELVSDPASLKPAAAQASYLSNRLRDLGILASTDGPLHNVIKIKPPMVFNRKDADFLLETTERVLREDFMKV
ncbi:MAG: aminotransferase class III-fold pyridoxal phosphate-dependent enzyme [Saprospiraceae bacterium]